MVLNFGKCGIPQMWYCTAVAVLRYCGILAVLRYCGMRYPCSIAVCGILAVLRYAVSLRYCCIFGICGIKSYYEIYLPDLQLTSTFSNIFGPTCFCNKQQNKKIEVTNQKQQNREGKGRERGVGGG